VTLISIGSTAIGTRIITESSAGKLSFDVASCVALYMLPIVQRDLLVKYDWTKIVDLDPTITMFDGAYIYFGDTGRFWAYNKKLVPDNEMPRSWEDTLKPKWKGGKISASSAEWHSPLWPL
jgi:iron(III) transport system substrate-binding protein